MRLPRLNKGSFIKLLCSRQDSFQSKLVGAIVDGWFPRERLALLAEQLYLQEKWPSHIAHVYLKLDECALSDRALIKYIISILRAENLGVGSRGIDHSELASKFASFVGLPPDRLKAAQPTVQNRALMDWCDMSALERPWKEALAVHLACEGQASSMAKIGKGLAKNYGVTKDAMLFWYVHGGPVERRHSKAGLAILARHTSIAEEENVLYCYEMSCRLLCQFYDSILGD